MLFARQTDDDLPHTQAAGSDVDKGMGNEGENQLPPPPASASVEEQAAPSSCIGSEKATDVLGDAVRSRRECKVAAEETAPFEEEEGEGEEQNEEGEAEFARRPMSSCEFDAIPMETKPDAAPRKSQADALPVAAPRFEPNAFRYRFRRGVDCSLECVTEDAIKAQSVSIPLLDDLFDEIPAEAAQEAAACSSEAMETNESRKCHGGTTTPSSQSLRQPAPSSTEEAQMGGATGVDDGAGGPANYTVKAIELGEGHPGWGSDDGGDEEDQADGSDESELDVPLSKTKAACVTSCDGSVEDWMETDTDTCLR